MREFNRAQRERGKDGCSNGSACNWLKIHRPKVAICPHKQDYCDTCSKTQVSLKAKQTTLNCSQQSGSASTADIKAIEKDIELLQAEDKLHRKEAQESHKYHLEYIEKCKRDVKKIHELEKVVNPTNDQQEELKVLKHKFTLVLSADYHMS